MALSHKFAEDAYFFNIGKHFQTIFSAHFPLPQLLTEPPTTRLPILTFSKQKTNKFKKHMGVAKKKAEAKG